ncbi:STAS domain-containing protein [Amycolatopsis sp. NPDC051758]|uniref:STAS domain-containing protein n=1 Tax=Amycolatopsis sp. NPDC051758 TaxID=3363935 RepID=UPI0037A70BC4
MAAPPTFAVAVTSTDRETLLSGTGEIDSAVSEDLRTRLTSAVEAGKPVILDLSAVTFCDSSGLTALIHGHTTAEAAGTEFVLVTAQRAILRPITLLGLADLLRIHPDLESARAALGPGGAA